MNTRTLAPTAITIRLALEGCSRQEAPLGEARQAIIRQEVLQAPFRARHPMKELS